VNFAQTIEKCSNGRIQIKVYGGGELVPPFEVFDAVSRGTAELGHSGAYYWKGKAEAASFFSSVPFGLTATEMNAWLYFGGGLELWREVYAPFGIIPVPCGNSGAQMGGWFNREIKSIADLKGLKMRIPGLGGEVLARAGGTPVALADDKQFELILNQLRSRQIAVEQIETYARQQMAAAKERELREAMARADQQRNITESELSITVQSNQGKAEYARALQQAAQIRALAEAEAEKVARVGIGQAIAVGVLELMSADAEVALV